MKKISTLHIGNLDGIISYLAIQKSKTWRQKNGIR